MTQQFINNGDSGLQSRDAINDNFTELYGRTNAGVVSSVTAGSGLSGGTITSTGTIGLADTTVAAGSYQNANIAVDSKGRITAASNGSAVTSITAGTGLNGGVITSSGTVSLANTAVSPGSYVNANITVDQQGRITAAASGTVPRVISFGGSSILNTEVLVTYRAPETVTFPAAFSGSVAGLSANPTGSFVCSVFNDATLIGTATISTLGVLTLATVGGTTKTVNANTIMTIVAPGNAETVASGLTFSISLKGTI